MPHYMKEKLVYEYAPYNVLLFTANSTINSKGKLVMGAGTAKVVRDTYPGIDAELGKLIPHLSTFGLCIIDTGAEMGAEGELQPKFGAFQTKTLWWRESTLDLISYSVEKLGNWANNNKHFDIGLPFPGVGNGGLSRSQVLPLLEGLPNNVYIHG